MKTIIIDAGHGGTDPGATAFGIKEKDWNLKMSRYQYKRLNELGAKVSMTRTTDSTLESIDRANRIKNKFDLCISNHFNAFNGSARGIEAIHSIKNKPRFANDLVSALKQETSLPFRRVFSKKNEQGTDWYFMHRLTGTTEVVIIEYGFLDNKDDFNYYKNDANFYKAAEAIIKVLCKEVGVMYKMAQNNKVPTPKNKTNNNLYKVQAGAYSKIENAREQVYKLKKAGFDAFITQ